MFAIEVADAKKIYENSGRADLAHGLKNSISKAKQTI